METKYQKSPRKYFLKRKKGEITVNQNFFKKYKRFRLLRGRTIL